jgi:DNA-directed RNA polymerase specialized sigma24 family protein
MFSAIEQLDPTLRNAIGFQITQEYSMKEMARALDLSVPAVKARLHRARKTLARQRDHRGPHLVAQKHREFDLRIGRQHA